MLSLFTFRRDNSKSVECIPECIGRIRSRTLGFCSSAVMPTQESRMDLELSARRLVAPSNPQVYRLTEFPRSQSGFQPEANPLQSSLTIPPPPRQATRYHPYDQPLQVLSTKHMAEVIYSQVHEPYHVPRSPAVPNLFLGKFQGDSPWHRSEAMNNISSVPPKVYPICHSIHHCRIRTAPTTSTCCPAYVSDMRQLNAC